ncbi:MAG: hypothetical protein A3H88_02260 [Candidatus Blackburnbacteria bacterium RIFCSPLOWO2_02_FULL_44_9]|uniref:N-acetyltransferase domain-containing protein n=1 Tax=Candidatus Blackburnbacteria bacterium RIFCSPHIGHO2_02_FULL_44_20 TaxID=1797516 RepID=A0A1G1V7V8_9BACT|nr:MAG: hypothetical protein A3E16_01105 [Candidatus Blackburnbacteria bacterium RIFCSPHIGHO2_12_FULL_44_25]OGY11282.1 MAG: hypothetical protein A3D26_02160 [Candidatus Blackburnbacteria bacterium RIFCSPHIGHO2_02_FULL_44_20]OGY15386.1 MAG: hypothetical protein A3H88_02260 [Candidatus Blackburnbacteria bacterium RIFCSPLOWO2_02_FULL_44_9]
MTREEKFKTVWDLTATWGVGLLFDEIFDQNGIRFFFNYRDPSIYSNYALPLSEQVDFEKIIGTHQAKGKTPAVYLQQSQQASGILEEAVKKGFSLDTRDTWMILDVKNRKRIETKPVIIEVNPENYEDYKKIMFSTFADFPGNESYFEMCRKTLDGIQDNHFADLCSEFYLIYEDQIPVSGAGMFYSRDGSFAYLHATGTMEDYRGKGYQTALINHRINKALNLNVKNIYSMVEHGSQSWKNMIKNNFDQVQVGYILTKPF